MNDWRNIPIERRAKAIADYWGGLADRDIMERDILRHLKAAAEDAREIAVGPRQRTRGEKVAEQMLSVGRRPVATEALADEHGMGWALTIGRVGDGGSDEIIIAIDGDLSRSPQFDALRRVVAAAIDAEILAEREACLRAAEETQADPHAPQDVAARIRARR